jgi:hypothetical protein
MKKVWRVFSVFLIAVAMVLPIAIPMPVLASESFSAFSSTSDGDIWSDNAVYNTSWIAATGTPEDIGNNIFIGQSTNGATYAVYRGYFYFDTSALPDTATVTSAKLKLYGVVEPNDDFSLVIQEGMPTYPHDPLAVGDFDKANYAGDGGSLNTSTFITAGYNSITLNATGLTWVNLTGETKLALRSSLDISGTSPTGAFEYAVVNSSDYAGTDHDPVLEVTYTMPAGATAYIQTNNAANIQATSATLQGTLLDLGAYGSGNVSFEYGTTANYGTDTAEATLIAVSAFSGSATGLSYNTTYHFRAIVRFVDSYFYGEDNSFTTLPASGSTTDLRIINADVFGTYKESGDMLFVVEATCNYTGYFPGQNAGLYFCIQLLDTDGTTILGQAPLYNWGDRPGSIYINATKAATLIEASAYYLKLLGYGITGTPSTTYTLQSTDWHGAELRYLDDWCISTAKNMQISDNRSDYVASLTDQGEVITNVAGGYFSIGIPGITEARPSLFTTSQVKTLFPSTTPNNLWDSAIAWSTYVGANITADATVFAAPFGITGKDVLAGLIGILILGFVMMVVGGSGGAGALGAVLISVPVLWLGTYFRIIPVAVLTLIVVFFGAFAIRQFIIKTL